MLNGRWRDIEILGVAHVCTGCRADYRLLKAGLRREPALPVTVADGHGPKLRP